MISYLHTAKAPSATGFYSQAVKAGDFLFISGQLPIDPKNNRMLGADIRQQTQQVLKNIINAILSKVDLGLMQLVKIEIYLQDINDIEVMNEVYQDYFSDHVKPARQVVAVRSLPKNALIEISAIALYNHKKQL